MASNWADSVLAPLRRPKVGAVEPNLSEMDYPDSKGLGGLRFSDAAARLLMSDVWLRHSQVQAARLDNDDWFFSNFEMD